MHSARERTGIIALVPDAFSGVWTTRHHVLTRLARHFPVVWVNPSPGWRELWLAGPLGKRAAQLGEVPPELNILAPSRFAPELYRPKWLRVATRRARYQAACRVLKRTGVERIAIYMWRPDFADALQHLQHDFSCYHIDDEYSFSRVDLPNTAEEVSLIAAVDQVIVHSPRLMQKKGSINPRTVMIPNGVDYAAYVDRQPIPTDLAAIQGPRVGYIGVIKTQLDLNLMARVAERLAGVSFIFVGPVGHLGNKQAAWAALTALPNVYAMGSRDVSVLPAYAQHLDVSLMCYEVTDYTNAIFPLKLNEYLAAGCPVVSSRIESVVPFASVLQIADGEDSWTEAICSALNSDARSETAIAERQAVAKKYDWDTLVTRIASLFD